MHIGSGFVVVVDCLHALARNSAAPHAIGITAASGLSYYYYYYYYYVKHSLRSATAYPHSLRVDTVPRKRLRRHVAMFCKPNQKSSQYCWSAEL